MRCKRTIGIQIQLLMMRDELKNATELGSGQSKAVSVGMSVGARWSESPVAWLGLIDGWVVKVAASLCGMLGQEQSYSMLSLVLPVVSFKFCSPLEY